MNSQKSFIQSHPYIQRFLKSWLVFDKYFAKTEESPIYAAAIILHPARRLLYIKKNWKKEWHKPAITAVKKLWETYKDIDIVDISENETRDLDIFDAIAKGYEVSQDYEDEYEVYIRQPVSQISGPALNWWLVEERRRPGYG